MVFFNPYAELEIAKANLPHWRQDNVTYFVTFRLADSLPAATWKHWSEERERWLKERPEPWDEAVHQEYHKKFSARLQEYLDAREGSCVLAIPSVKRLVTDALRHFDGLHYGLGECVTAANHVHCIVTPCIDRSLSHILHSWKSYTSKEINKVEAASRRLDETIPSRIEGRATVWQKESYDHMIRNARALWRIEQYIRSHPEYEMP